ncbi:MAG TPA: hypothetical protein DCX27_13180 [Balneola sp.]|nr:hypothetical protein [Balneola sp.]
MSYYFDNFPTINYEYTPGILKRSLDILRRTDVTSRLLNSNQYDQLIISDGETPQSLAIKVYDDVSLYWSFFITNRLVNPFYDWPLPYEKLNKRINSKYAGVSLYVTEDSNGLTMDTQSATSSYSIDETVKIYNGSDTLLDTATIKDYDRTTGHMQLSGANELIEESVSDWYVTDTVGSKKMYVARKFDESRYALNYFREPDLSSVVDAITTYKSPLTLYGESGTRYIDTYINVTALDTTIPATIVTNEMNESELNDRKRNIRVYNKNVISSIESEIKRMINTT